MVTSSAIRRFVTYIDRNLLIIIEDFETGNDIKNSYVFIEKSMLEALNMVNINMSILTTVYMYRGIMFPSPIFMSP